MIAAARPAPERALITGLVLAGGRGRRMGGVDKGLLPWAGSTLAGHAAARLAPQVAQVAINANRELAAHRVLGLPVWPDGGVPAGPVEAYAGPLAGWLAGLSAARTEWLLSVPCDTPGFPLDLALRLCRALAGPGAPPIALAATADGPQPVFALLHQSLQHALAQALAAGERSAWRFAQAQDAAVVLFDDALAFADADTPAELARLREQAAGPGAADPAAPAR